MATIRLADDITALGTEKKTFDVHISYEVVKLFSEQLYASPVKAVEELVVQGRAAAIALLVLAGLAINSDYAGVIDVIVGKHAFLAGSTLKASA